MPTCTIRLCTRSKTFLIDGRLYVLLLTVTIDSSIDEWNHFVNKVKQTIDSTTTAGEIWILPIISLICCSMVHVQSFINFVIRNVHVSCIQGCIFFNLSPPPRGGSRNMIYWLVGGKIWWYVMKKRKYKEEEVEKWKKVENFHCT